MIDQERCIRNNKTGQSSDFFLHIPPDVDGKYLYTEKNRTMKIEQNVIDQIVAQSQKDAPIESCGYLLGKDGVATENYPMTNTDHAEEHFSFDPREQFAALRHARAQGLQILANWHSHPASPSRPSQEDLRLANDPNIQYVIVSLHEGIHVNSFKIENNQVVSKEIHL